MSRGPSRARQLGYILPASSSCRVVWPRRDPSSRARLINWTMDAALQRRSESDSKHFREKVAPNGFGAQVVTFDRESCLLYKQELDRHLPPEVSDVVIFVNSGEDEYAAYRRDRDAEEKLLDRFRDPK